MRNFKHNHRKRFDDDYDFDSEQDVNSQHIRISKNSDNRVFCPEIGREKFRYETKEKALLACKYSSNKQRPYYCNSCCAWHTTSMNKGKYYGLKASEG